MLTLVDDRVEREEDLERDALPFERRRGLRVPQERPVKVYEPAASRFFGGRTRNISASGLQMEFPLFVQLRPGRVINVHIGTEAGGQPLANRRSMIPARVVWMRTDSDESPTHLIVGVEFLANITAGAAA